MTELQLGTIESKFADIIWKNEPLRSSELVKLCENELGWKKSTTFTVLRRLCEKGIFCNFCGDVTSLISREEFYSMQSEKFITETFNGSLPAFLAAFTKRKSLTKEDADALRRIVENYKED